MHVSAKSKVLPTRATDSLRPSRARLIGGMAELLLRFDIVRKLDITVVCRGNQFRVGNGESEMMTYIEKHHWVFPLVPIDCAR